MQVLSNAWHHDLWVQKSESESEIKQNKGLKMEFGYCYQDVIKKLIKDRRTLQKTAS